MKLFQVLLILVVAAYLINWVKQGQTFHIAEVLPFAGGPHPPLYDLGSIVLLAMAWCGFQALKRRYADD